jgi:hypothetical protein
VRIVAFAPDLMDRSKISAAAPEVQFVTLDQLPTVEADLVLIDLSRPGAADSLPKAKWIGFASHVDRDLFELGHVLPRSKFFADLPALLTP